MRQRCEICGCPVDKDTLNLKIDGETGNTVYLCDMCYEIEELDFIYQQTLKEKE